MLSTSLSIFSLACLTGFIFTTLNMPLPWTLGPLFSTVLWKVCIRKPVIWPKQIRNICLAVLGYVLGSPFTPENGLHILSQIPLMLAITVSSIIFCLLAGFLAGRYAGISLESSLIGSIPGGLSQMSTICEETKGTDITVVTLMQTIRVVTVVFAVPFLALHGIADRVNAVSKVHSPLTLQQVPMLLFFALVIIGLILLAKHSNISSSYVIAPIIGTAFLVLSGFHPPALPSFIIALAQICIGIRMGLDVEFASLQNWKRIAVASLISILSVIGLLLGLAYTVSLHSANSLVTAFLSMAPGGISEMGLTATIANADVSTVVSFQLFRLIFVLLVVVPLVKWWLTRTKLATAISDTNN